jgi:uncharacterized membrane protein YobD (UPF0266 family)
MGKDGFVFIGLLFLLAYQIVSDGGAQLSFASRIKKLSIDAVWFRYKMNVSLLQAGGSYHVSPTYVSTFKAI